eukprot:gene7680-13504_t
MILAISYCLFQALLLNFFSGLLLAVVMDYSRCKGSMSFLGRHQSLKLLLMPINVWMERVQDIINRIDRKCLFFVTFKSMIDILVHLNNNPTMNSHFGQTCLALTPINTILSLMLIGSDIEADIAMGTAWGFYRYLKVTGEFLEESINQSRYSFKLNLLPKRFILIPSNGNVRETLTEMDKRIEFTENTASLKLDSNGTKLRPYFQSVHLISPQFGEFDEFYCIIEQAASAKSVHDLALKGFLSQNATKRTMRWFYDILQMYLDSDIATRTKFELIFFSGNDCDVVNSIVERRTLCLKNKSL